MSPRFVVEEAEGTRRLAERFAAVLRGGDLVLLSGDLGAGKTTFVQGIARGLGIADPVTSPTFVLAREHPLAGGGRFVHADAYRLESFAELEDMIEDLVGEEAITAVEWGDVVGDALGRASYLVRLSLDSEQPDGRTIEIDGVTDDARAHLERGLGADPT